MSVGDLQVLAVQLVGLVALCVLLADVWRERRAARRRRRRGQMATRVRRP